MVLWTLFLELCCEWTRGKPPDLEAINDCVDLLLAVCLHLIGGVPYFLGLFKIINLTNALLEIEYCQSGGDDAELIMALGWLPFRNRLVAQ